MIGPYEYGFWWLVIFHVALFLFFGVSFLTPRGRGAWRSFGALTTFIVALYTEMYDFEERELEARFGQDYRAYQERVPGFIPRWPPSHARGGIPGVVGQGEHRRPEFGS
jgi:protein-S-isoprenylcysteine O-methyltransferase Ste14